MNGYLRFAIPIVAAAGLALPAGAAAAPCANADLVPAAGNIDSLRHATLCLVNRERVTRRRVPLALNDELTAAADAYAQTMAAQGFFSHVSPSGSTPVSRIRAALYLNDAARWSIGENLAWGGGIRSTPRQMVVAWMRSASHRANILSPRYRQLGVGVGLGVPEGTTAQSGAVYATEFGVRTSASPRGA